MGETLHGLPGTFFILFFFVGRKLEYSKGGGKRM